jgi:hypothetical protein
MTVSLIVGTVRTLVETTDDPTEVLAGLNRRLYGRLNNGFATCWCFASIQKETV